MQLRLKRLQNRTLPGKAIKSGWGYNGLSAFSKALIYLKNAKNSEELLLFIVLPK